MKGKTKEKKEKSIKIEIKKMIVLLVIGAILELGVASCILNIISTRGTLKSSMEQMAVVAAERVEWELTSYKDIVVEMGSVARLAKEDLPVEDKKSIVDQRVATHEMVKGDILDGNGISIFDGTDFSDTEFHQRTMNGEVCIMDPDVSDGEIHILIAAPLWEGGIPDTKVIGTVYLEPDPSFLNDIVNGINVSKRGSAYMINETGTVIAHKNIDSVLSQENSIEEAKTDSSLKKIAALESRMINGESGFGTYFYGGSNKLLAFAPIEGTDGWSIAINAPLSDFMGMTYIAILIVIIIGIINIFATRMLSGTVAERISVPVNKCTDRLKLLAEGDLQTEMPVIEREDEIGVLAKATTQIVTAMQKMIQDVHYLLAEMAEGNLDIDSKATEYYVGDFKEILSSLRKIKSSLSETMYQIKSAADQVSSGAGQLAQSATELAEGATDQAGAVEELFATITDVTDQVQVNAEAAGKTSKDAQSIGTEAEESSRQMAQMTEAMERISNASKEIENIIGSIEEIADQTNLLALNASIEAARAGEAGKGFAVVANEIGQLAKQSQVAVENTRNLIATALAEVERGNVIVENTSTSMSKVVNQIESIVAAVENVNVNCENQALSMKQLDQGVEQISNVVQNNSATAEESSATSQELYAQAVSLNELVNKFKLAK